MKQRLIIAQAIMERPDVIMLDIETHGLDTPPYEHFTVCPHCGGAFVEAHRCDCCGEFITADYVVVQDGRRYCEECYSIRNIEDDLAA